MRDSENHQVETYLARHFDETVEVWCPTVDEAKVLLGHQYIRYCPMCGDSIEVEIDPGHPDTWESPNGP